MMNLRKWACLVNAIMWGTVLCPLGAAQPVIVSTPSYYPSGGIGTLSYDGSGNLYYSNGVSYYRQSTTGGPKVSLPLSVTPITSLAGSEFGLFLFASQNQVYRMTAAGSVELAAGTMGVFGLVDGPAEQARFGNSLSMALDALGNIYVADKDNFAIRKISPDGYVTTLAGAAGESEVLDGVGSYARFQSPTSILRDAAGDFLILDGRRIRKMTPDGIVTTFAGNETFGNIDGVGASASFRSPSFIVLAGDGNYYVTDLNVIRKVSPSGEVTTIAGGRESSPSRVDGIGLDASFLTIKGLALAQDGGLIVGENTAFRHLAIEGVPFAPVIETAPVGQTLLAGDDLVLSVTAYGAPFPSYQWSRNGVVLIGQTSATLDVLNATSMDSGAYTVRISNEHGFVESSAVDVDIRVVADNNMFSARVALSGASVFASEHFVGATREDDEPTHFVGAGGGSLWWSWTAPADGYVTFDASASSVVAAVRLYEGASLSILSDVSAEDSYYAVNSDARSTVAVSAGVTYQIAIEKFAEGGAGIANLAINYTHMLDTFAGVDGQSAIVNGTGVAANFSDLSGIAQGSSGDLYVSDATTIRKITPLGVVTTFATGSFNRPDDLTIDASGNLYLADTSNHVIRKISSGGSVSNLAGQVASSGSQNGNGTGARFHFPSGLVVDGAGVVYVADKYNHVIRKVTAAGEVTTLVGATGFSGGEDGVGAAARFQYPSKIALNGTVLYVLDQIGLRVIDLSTLEVSTLVSTGSWSSSSSLTVDSTGAIYVGTPGEVYRVSSLGSVVTLLGGNNPIGGVYADGDGLHASFGSTNGIVVDASGVIWFTSRNTVYRARSSSMAIAPVLHADPESTVVSIGSDHTLRVAAFGGPSLSYQWSKDSVELTGETEAALGLTNLQLSDAGSYSVSISNSSGSVVSGAAAVTVVPLPVNDYFSNAAILSGTSADGVGTNYGASLENDEPVASDLGAGHTLWWSWTAPSDGTVVVDSGGSGIKVSLGVFTGVSVSSLELLGASNDASSTDPAKVYFTVVAGEVYHFAMDGLAGESVTSGSLRVNVNYMYAAQTLGGAYGYADGPIEDARFSSPSGIALDSSGNLYVADQVTNVIRKISASGNVTTLAGQVGVSGSMDGIGNAATFSGVVAMTTDPSGDIYAVEATADIIRKITPAGAVTTFAGVSNQGALVDGIGSLARFNNPKAIVYAPDGYLYVVDGGNSRIRKINVNTAEVTTLGSGSAIIANSITYGSDGYLYIVDPNRVIRRVDPVTGDSTIIAGSGSSSSIDGFGAEATFNTPTYISADGDGGLYVLSFGGQKLRRVSLDGHVITVAGGNDSQPARDGVGLDARFDYFSRGMVAAANGTLYMCASNTIRRVIPTGLERAAMIRAVPDDVISGLGSDVGVAFEIDVYPAPTYVWKRDGSVVTGQVSATLQLASAQLADSGDYVLEVTNSIGTTVSPVVRIDILDTPLNDDFSNRTVIASIPSTIDGYNVLASQESGEPTHVQAGGGHTVWWSWTAPHDGVVMLNTQFSPIDTLVAVYTGSAVDALSLVAAGGRDSSGLPARLSFNVEAGVSYEIALDGASGDIGLLEFELFYAYGNEPFDNTIGGYGIVSDSAANVYLADTANHVIRKISSSGVVSDIAGLSGTSGSADGVGVVARFNSPTNLARASDGTLYVTDLGNHTIRKIAPDGTVSTLAGLATVSGAVDDVGASARFYGPHGIALSSDETQLVIVDSYNYVLRKLDIATGSVSTLAGRFGEQGTQVGYRASARFMRPVDVERSVTGSFYVTDAGQYQSSPWSGMQYFYGVKEVTIHGHVSVLAGRTQGGMDGQGSDALFGYSVRGLDVDASGNAYVIDGSLIRRITPDGHVTTLSLPLAYHNDLALFADGTGYGVSYNGVQRLVPMSQQVPDPLPVISKHPISVARNIGNTVYFSIEANGAVNDFTYQWKKNGSDILGETNATLTLVGISLAQAGDYTVVVTSDAGSITSNAATLTVNPAPVNDVFANANVLSGFTAQASADNTGAGKESGEPVHAGNTGGASLWWTWTAPASGAVIVDSAGSTVDPLIAIYTGASVDALTEVASARKAVASIEVPNPSPAALSFLAIEGTVYHIAMDGEAGFSGTLELRLNYTYNFTTLAGLSGELGGDDGNASVARFAQPHEVAIDAIGNVFVADSLNHVIRKITPAGEVSTFAGLTGAPGTTDATGTAARFNYPTGLVISAAGDLFVADYGNHIIRKVTPAGVVSTFAGSAGAPGLSNGTGAAARFTTPRHLAIDSSDDLYVTDYGKYWIRKITPAAVVSTFAGQAEVSGATDATGTSALFSQPEAMSFDSSGGLYVCDGNTLRRVTSGGVVTTVAGVAGENSLVDGSATIVRIKHASSVAVRSDGSVLIADSGAIRMLASDGSVVTLVGSSSNSSGSVNGSGRSVRFNGLNQLKLTADGQLYTTEISGHVVRRGLLSRLPAPPSITLEPEDVRVVEGSSVTLSCGAIANPLPTYQWQKDGADILNETGTSLVLVNAQPSDSGAYRLVAMNSEGATSSIAAQVEILPLPSNDDFLNAISVTGEQATVSAYNYSATSEGSEPSHAGSVAANSVWFTWVAPGTGSVNVDTLGSDFETRLAVYFGSSLDSLSLHAEDSSADQQLFSRVRFNVDAGDVVHIAVDGVFGATGEIELEIGYSWTFSSLSGGFASRGAVDGALGDARFDFPTAMASDTSGNLYVADRGNHTIRKISSAGVVSTLAGSAGLSGAVDGTGSVARFHTPYGLTVDAAGNVYVADAGNSAVRKITPAGVVTTLAGLLGSSGSADGTGSNARFGLPVGIALNESEDLYVTDYSNNLIRKVTSGGVVTTFAGELNGVGGVSRFSAPWGIAVDANGFVYVSDRSNIRRISPEGAPALFAGTLNGEVGDSDGIGGAARFDGPAEIAFDENGHLIVADQGNNSIRKISATGIVRTIAGDSTRFGYLDGIAEVAAFAYPAGVTVTANGEILVADSYNQLIRRGVQKIAQEQAITFSPIEDLLYSETPLVLSASASSGLPVTFQLLSGPASLVGNVLSFTGAGTVTVRAQQGGSEDYLSAVSIDRSFAVYGYDGWLLNAFSPTELMDPLVSGLDSDFDADGLSTLLEYALGLDPTQANFSNLPVSNLTMSDLAITYTRPENRSDLNYTVKVSFDLQGWLSTGVVHELISTDNGVQTWRGSYSLNDEAEVFIRLEVER